MRKYDALCIIPFAYLLGVYVQANIFCQTVEL